VADLDQIPFCCGINELGHIANDESAQDTLMGVDPYDLNAHVIFSVTSSQTAKHLKGYRLAATIRRNKLGKVVSTQPAKNPGHDGTLKAWIWTPDVKAFAAYQARIKKLKPSKYDPDCNTYEQDPYRWW
jgi:hypothetical protein